MAEAEYIALKTLKVHELEADGTPKIGDDGRPVLRQCKPGDPIPEAKTWRNLWREIRAGRVGVEGTAIPGPVLADTVRRRLADSTRPIRKQVRRPKPDRQRQRPEDAPTAELQAGGKSADDPEPVGEEAEPSQPVEEMTLEE